MSTPPPTPHAKAEEDWTGTVLVIDDELPNRMYIKKILEKQNCRVLTAIDGTDGIRQVEAFRPDLVLVDVMMPGLDGYAVCRLLTGHERTRDIPVMMVTARHDIEDLEKGFENGAVDYIRKPFNPRELVARVRTALALKKAQDKVRQWQTQMSEQLKLAGILQRSLFDLHPQFTHDMVIRKATRPCEGVGGDVFDVIALPNGRYAVYMADVCGHGVGPAIISSLLKALTSGLLVIHAHDHPSAICNALNSRFTSNVSDPSIYATFFLGIYEPVSKLWRCMSCGHPPPVLILPNGVTRTALFMEGGGLPIGFSDVSEEPYRVEDEISFSVEPGESLFLYTDGLIEAPHADTGTECGIEGLTDTARAVLNDPSKHDWAEEVLQALAQKGYELGLDDCSAIAIKMLKSHAQALSTTIPASRHSVVEIARQVEHVVLERNWPEEAAAAIQLLVLEHGMNIIKHGRPDPSSAILVQLWMEDDIARVYFEDYGYEWEYAEFFNSAELSEDSSESGRGLAILKTIAEHIDLFRRDRRNIAAYTVRRDFSVSSSSP